MMVMALFRERTRLESRVSVVTVSDRLDKSLYSSTFMHSGTRETFDSLFVYYVVRPSYPMLMH